MTFLMIANSPNSLLNFRLNLIKSLQAAGYIVHAACPIADQTKSERTSLAQHGVTVHHIPMSRTGLNPLSDLVTLHALYKLMRKLRPKAVLSYTIKPVIWGSLAAFFANVPNRFALITGLGYVFADDAQSSNKQKLTRRAVESLYALALNRCARIFFQNPDDESLFRQLGIIKNTMPTTVVKGSGVDLLHFEASPLPDQPVFILIARLLIDKGVRQYAEAAIQLKSRHPRAQFKLVGYLDENPKSIKQAELDAWIASGKIDYLGKLSDVRPALSQASVFVLPTFYREGIPRTILEALAMGRAVITTDTPGCRETVVQGVNGYLVEPRSVEDLIDAMEKFILDAALAAKMGEASLELARKDFDVNKVNIQMLHGMDIHDKTTI